jgi:hypothetical protein
MKAASAGACTCTRCRTGSKDPTAGLLDFSNTANFGRITALRLGANDQRQIQLALKYYF